MTPKILLIEKDASIASLLTYPLVREGYDITRTANEESGFSEAKRRLYDLILYDMEEPQSAAGEGELLHKLRQHRIDTPLLIISSKADEAHIAKCLRIGAEDYIVKPFEVETFLARIFAVLRRSKHLDLMQTTLQMKESESIEIGSLFIYPDKYEVSCNGTTLSLPTKEFELLVYLADRKGTVVSRNELAHQFWHTINQKNCRKVDVYMSRIRKKFEPFSTVSIQAVRGRGYKIVE